MLSTATRTSTSHVLRRTIVLSASLLMLAFPGAAWAASSSGTGYSTPGESTETETASGDATEAAAAPARAEPAGGGFLPFTGLDLKFVGGVAAALLSMGLVLRRLSAPRPGPAAAGAPVDEPAAAESRPPGVPQAGP